MLGVIKQKLITTKFRIRGGRLKCGDIVIRRCAESGANYSIKLKHTERGMVQKVVLSSNDGGKILLWYL